MVVQRLVPNYTRQLEADQVTPEPESAISKSPPHPPASQVPAVPVFWAVAVALL